MQGWAGVTHLKNRWRNGAGTNYKKSFQQRATQVGITAGRGVRAKY